jgi:hypothetical protein
MKYVGKYKKLLTIVALLIIGLASWLIWAEREDRIQIGGHPNNQARNALLRILGAENNYLSKYNDFARSLSKLKLGDRVDFHKIEFVSAESNSQTIVYRAMPDRFNWLMFDNLNVYTIAIIKLNSAPIGIKPLLCSSSQRSNIVPKIEFSIPFPRNSTPVLKCSKGSHEVPVSDP